MGDKIQVGDIVRIERITGWYGKWLLKKYQDAEVIAIVPDGISADDINLGPEFRFRKAYGVTRDHESYLCALPMKPKGRTRKVYWPRVKDIQKIPTF